ncbi:MAG: hypothetical protein ACPGUE_21275 [Marinomonas sp.]
MATLEEIDAEIARRKNATPQYDLAAIDAEIAKRQQKQQKPEPMSKWEAAKQGFGIVKDAVKGNAEFKDAGNYADYIEHLADKGFYKDRGFFDKGAFEDINRLGDAGAFGNTEDQLNMLKDINPNAQIKQDNSGNPYVTEDGKPFYPNKPGLDTQDITEAAAQALAYTPAIKAGGVVGNVAGKSLLTGSLTGATNAGLQKAAGRENVDGEEVINSAVLGAGAELISPYAGKLFAWAKNKLNGSSGAIKEGKKVVENLGLSEADDNTLELIGKMRLSVDDAVSDAAIIAEMKHGFKLTRGKATGSIKQQAKEEQLRNQPVLMDKFKQIDDFNRDAVETNLKKIRSNLYDGVDDALQPAATAETALESLKTAAGDAKQAYKGAYNDVGNLYVKSEAAQGLGKRLTAAAHKNNVRISERATPKAMEALEIVQEGVDMLKPGTKGFSIKGYDSQRKLINSLYSKNMDGTDRKALTVIKNELDDWFYSSVDDSLLKGDPAQLEKLTKARGMMSDYMNRFQSKDKAKKVITDIINDGVSPEDFSNMLVGVNGYSKKGSANAVKAYKEAVGVDSDGFKALQANVFEKLIMGGVNPSTGSAAIKGYEGLLGTFHQAFTNKGSSMMKTLFDNKTALEIKSLMRSVGKLVTPNEVKNPSGSGRFMAQFMNQHGNKFPILSNLWNGAKSVKNYSTATTLPAQVVNNELRQGGALLQISND